MQDDSQRLYHNEKKRPGKHTLVHILFESRWYGEVGAVLLLPSIITSGIIALSPIGLSGPLLLAFISFLDFFVFGALGYLLADLTMYSFMGRIFLTAVLIALVIGAVGGLIWGMVALLSQLVQVLWALAVLAAIICIALIVSLSKNEKDKHLK